MVGSLGGRGGAEQMSSVCSAEGGFVRQIPAAFRRDQPLSVIRVLRPISSKADLQVSPNRRKPSAAAHSLVKPSLLHASEPTPLWTKKSPLGSYFFLISASRG